MEGKECRMSLKPSGNDRKPFCSNNKLSRVSTLSPAKSQTRSHPAHEAHGKVDEEGGSFTDSF